MSSPRPFESSGQKALDEAMHQKIRDEVFLYHSLNPEPFPLLGESWEEPCLNSPSGLTKKTS